MEVQQTTKINATSSTISHRPGQRPNIPAQNPINMCSLVSGRLNRPTCCGLSQLVSGCSLHASYANLLLPCFVLPLDMLQSN